MKEQKKKIYFCIDCNAYYYQMDKNPGAVGCHDYVQTLYIMNKGLKTIVTYQLSLMTFDQIGDYEAYICYRRKAVRIKEGMQLSESGYCLTAPTYAEDPDIIDIFNNGYFDKKLGYNPDKL